jgi:hypothetical protein
MRQETQHWDNIRVTFESIVAGVGQAGLTVQATIRRNSDGLWWDGAAWAAGPTVLAVPAVDAVNLPGLYAYAFDPGDYAAGLDGYLVEVAEGTTPWLEYILITPLRRSAWDDTLADHTAVGSAGESLASIDPSGIAASVWDETASDHVAAGSFGLLTNVTAGLNQYNHRLKSPTFDAEGRMTSAVLSLFHSSGDADSDSGAFASITLTMTYDAEGNLESILGKD